MNNFVLDTNVIISIFQRNRMEWLEEISTFHAVYIYTCTEQLKELQDVYEKYPKVRKMLTAPIEKYLEFLMLLTEQHEATQRFKLVKDYKDNYLVDLCIQTQSTLVTNDKDFDFLKKLKSPDIQVINLNQFYKKFGK